MSNACPILGKTRARGGRGGSPARPQLLWASDCPPVCSRRTGCPPQALSVGRLTRILLQQAYPPQNAPNTCLCHGHTHQALSPGPLAVTLSPATAPGDRPMGQGGPRCPSSVLYLASEKGGVDRRGENQRNRAWWRRHCAPRPGPGLGTAHPTPQPPRGRPCSPHSTRRGSGGGTQGRLVLCPPPGVETVSW